MQDSLVVFRIASRHCALPVGRVHETMRPGPIERLPDAPAFVAGATVSRGEAIPVIDLAALLEVAPDTPPTRLVIVRLDGGRRAGLLVTAVVGVSARADLGGPLPALLSEAGPGVVERLARVDGALLTVLRASHLVPDAVWGAVAARAAQR